MAKKVSEMPEQQEKIYLEHNGYDKLKTIFKVSRQTVWKALTNQTQSDIAKKIRHTALTQLGGVLINNQTVCPTDIQSVYNYNSLTDTGKTMIQTFANGITLVIDKESGTIRINGKNGKQHSCIKDASIKQIAHMQEMARAIMV